MDVVLENLEVEASKVSVEDKASGGLKASEISVPATAPTASSSVQAAFFLSSKPSAVTSPSPVQLESHSLTPHIAAPPAAADARAVEMATSVEPSTTVSTTIFHSPSVVFPPQSSLPSDTAALVLPASSSSSLLDVSAAPGVAIEPSSIPSSLVGSPTYSPAVASLSRESLTAYSSSDMFQTSSAIQSGDAHSESLGCSSPGGIPQPGMPSGGVGMNSSGQLLALPTTLAPVEVPRPRPLEMPPSEGAGTASETPSFSSADLSKQQRSALSFTSAPTGNTKTLQTPISSGSESQLDAPSFSIEELSALPAPAESNLEMPTSSVALPLPGVRETDSVALSGLPVGASTGLLTEQLETSTSFPSALKATSVKRQRPAEEDTDAPGVHKRSKKECKAGNPKCGLETGRSVLLGDQLCLPCDICCTEPGFCRECKCILCCKTIVPDLGESNFVRCVRIPSGNGMCGHAAHLECALTSKMAGVVKKRGLDMEYLCRRCDHRTDLRELVTLLLEAVGSTDVREQAEKSLELALEVMRGTERGGSGARVLESLVQTALRKVQSGVDIQEAFKELKDQGAAAEAARQQNLGRCSSLMDDAQQPEASLDQWLTSSGSPSSHPSPGTPSSFTSPRLKSNPSVTSGQLNGTPTVDGSLRKHRAAEGHTGHFVQDQTSQEGVSNSKYKNSHLGNKALIRNAGQVRGSHRIRAISSNVNNNGLEAICDSFTRTPGNHAAEPGSRDGNSSLRAIHNSNSVSKNLKDQRNSSSGPGKLREDIVSTEMCCKSCGACKRHTSNAVEITSSLKSAKTQDGGKKVPSTSREEEPGNYDTDKQVADSDTGFTGSGHPRSTNPANGSAHKTGTSLQLLDSQCEQDMQTALQKLRRAQEAEFERATACLAAKKESILRKYEVLQVSHREFSEHPVSSSLEVFDELFLNIGAQFAGAKQERDNFKTMLTIGEGFGSVSKDDLKKFYRWPSEK